LALAVALILAVAPGYFVILPGTRVAGVEVGGRTPGEAVVFLEETLKWEEKYLILSGEARSESALLFQDLGISPQVEKSILAARRPLWSWGKRDFPLYVKTNQRKFDSWVEDVAQRFSAPPVDARFQVSEDGRVSVVPGRSGYVLDQNRLKTAILEDERWFQIPVQLQVPVLKKDPEIGEAYLARFLPLNLVASHTTSYQDKNDRAHNILLAAKSLDGFTVWPGETLSFNKVVGPRTEDRGYRKASVFFGDEVIDDYGGGVCQVSTTLYVALLKAGFGIVERYNHGMPVSYVPLGLDATVVFDVLDLKMKNLGDAPFIIKVDAEEGNLTVKVFGKMEENLVIQVDSRVLKEVPADGQVVQEGDGRGPKLRSGFMVETIRRFIKGGQVVKVEKLNTSWYPPEKPKLPTQKGAS